MSRIVVDAKLREKLLQVVQPIELIDAGGHVLGRFLPEASQFDLDPNISDEELCRREQVGGGRALSEILRDLERKS